MITAHAPVRAAVVPAAGLGTRLLPATLVRSKELLPLGLWPAFCATLLEAQAAGLEQVVVVVSPGKEDLHRFLDPARWGDVGAPVLARLRALVSSVRLQIVEQPRPAGVLDAIERGLAVLDSEAPFAVLFPDLVHLPDQRALCTLIGAYQACGQAIYGLREVGVGAGWHGPSLCVEAQGGPAGAARRIRRLSPPGAARPGELRTTFGTIHTPAMTAAWQRCARPDPAGPLDDSRLCEALNQLAADGGLFGVSVPGEVVDLGHVPGYLDAARRFAAGEARLRGLDLQASPAGS